MALGCLDKEMVSQLKDMGFSEHQIGEIIEKIDESNPLQSCVELLMGGSPSPAKHGANDKEKRNESMNNSNNNNNNNNNSNENNNNNSNGKWSDSMSAKASARVGKRRRFEEMKNKGKDTNHDSIVISDNDSDDDKSNNNNNSNNNNSNNNNKEKDNGEKDDYLPKKRRRLNNSEKRKWNENDNDNDSDNDINDNDNGNQFGFEFGRSVSKNYSEKRRSRRRRRSNSMSMTSSSRKWNEKDNVEHSNKMNGLSLKEMKEYIDGLKEKLRKLENENEMKSNTLQMVIQQFEDMHFNQLKESSVLNESKMNDCENAEKRLLSYFRNGLQARQGVKRGGSEMCKDKEKVIAVMNGNAELENEDDNDVESESEDIDIDVGNGTGKEKGKGERAKTENGKERENENGLSWLCLQDDFNSVLSTMNEMKSFIKLYSESINNFHNWLGNECNDVIMECESKKYEIFECENEYNSKLDSFNNEMMVIEMITDDIRHGLKLNLIDKNKYMLRKARIECIKLKNGFDLDNKEDNALNHGNGNQSVIMIEIEDDSDNDNDNENENENDKPKANANGNNNNNNSNNSNNRNENSNSNSNENESKENENENENENNEKRESRIRYLSELCKKGNLNFDLKDAANGNGMNEYLSRFDKSISPKSPNKNENKNKDKNGNKDNNSKSNNNNNSNNESLFECGICFCEYKLDEILIFESCHHYYCLNCLMNTCKVKILDKTGVNDINCPFESCKHKITYQEIELILKNEIVNESELFEKYEKYLLELTLQCAKNCKVCPLPNCGFPMFGDPNHPMLECPKCNKKFCFNCETTDWHNGIACEAFQKWKLENNMADAKFEEWAKSNTKECPKCKSKIEKNGGCNHMTCKRCKYEFHWETMEKWKGYQHDYGATIYPAVPYQAPRPMRDLPQFDDIFAMTGNDRYRALRGRGGGGQAPRMGARIAQIPQAQQAPQAAPQGMRMPMGFGMPMQMPNFDMFRMLNNNNDNNNNNNDNNGNPNGFPFNF